MNIRETKHLDGTVCVKRKRAPKKSQIAFHWREKISELGLFFDWLEPSCWACGLFAFATEEELSFDFNQLELKDQFFIWDYHSYLERCHVIPKALGGCSCHGNLVLLCKDCHKDNPDTDNTELFLTWMKNRKPFGLKRAEQIIKAFDEFNLEHTLLNASTIILNDKFEKFVASKSVKVRSKYTDSTLASCLVEYKKLYTDIEIINQFDDNNFKDYLKKRTKFNKPKT